MPGNEFSPLASVQPQEHLLGRYWRIITGAPWQLRLFISIGILMLTIPRLYLLIVIQAQPEWLYRKDFLQEYVLVRAIAAGEHLYLPLPVLAERYAGPLPFEIWSHPTPHPPSLGLLFLPLAWVDYATAARWWLGIGLVALIVGMALIGRLAMGRWSVGWTVVLAALGLVWSPVVFDLALGNLNVILFSLLVGSWWALRSGHSLIGGVILGFSLLIKQVAWPVFLLLLWRRDYRAAFSALTTGLIGYLLTGSIAGADQVIIYVREVLPQVGGWYRTAGGNFSLWTIGPRLFDGTTVPDGTNATQIAPLFASQPLAWLVALAVPALVLVLTGLAVRRHLQHDHAFGVAVCLSVVINPIAWEYYLVLLIIPVAQVWAWLGRYRFPVQATNLTLLVLALLLVSWENWITLAWFIATPFIQPGSPRLLPVLPGLLALGPTLAVASLSCLLLRLAQYDQQPKVIPNRLSQAA